MVFYHHLPSWVMNEQMSYFSSFSDEWRCDLKTTKEIPVVFKHGNSVHVESHSLSSLLNYLRAFGDGLVAGVSGGQGIESCCTRAFGDGPRNFGQVTWMTPELAPPLLTTTPHQREDISALDRFSVHRCPTRQFFSGTELELVTKPATIRCPYHSATAAIQ
ncbi:uncharacterized protein TNCV_2169151 [Trichonephila clavipes]|nr:uncharacterized protein TNCV_2169151 [Trichonephila clavipes]